jgi:uncharacterized protein (TIRG00374 family)
MKRALRLALYVLAFLLFIWVLRSVSLADTWGILQRLGWWQLGLLALANGIVLWVGNGRWWLILRGQGYALPYLTLTGYRLAGYGLSYFTPGPMFGGEPLQVVLIERLGVRRATAVAAIALDKTLELIINFSFLLVGVAVVLQTQLLPGLGWATAVYPLSLLALPSFFLLAIWADWQPLSRLMGLISRLLLRPDWQPMYQRLQTGIQTSEAQAAAFCRQQPAALLLAFLVSLLSWATLIGEFWLMLTLLGAHLTFLEMVVLLTAARIAILLPLPGGLGTLDASQMFAFALLGMGAETAVSFTLLIRARDILLGGLGLWWGLSRIRIRQTEH